jgi:PAS domain S-box-containing protein
MRTLFFSEKTLRYIFYVLLVLTLAFPLINIFFIYPAFRDLVVEKSEDEAIRVTRHLRSTVMQEGSLPLSPEIYSSDTEALLEHFSILKLKVFDPIGEVVFSTEEKDIGTVNSRPYFSGIVARGMEYSKLVTKDSRSLEGQEFENHVVESYVPVMDGGRFMGAFEVYYDVTDIVESLRDVLMLATAVPFMALGAFVMVISALLQRVDRNIEVVRKAEETLTNYKDSLERQVDARAAALREANEELEREISERTIAARALKDSESFLNSIFESIHDPFCIFDRNLFIVKANEEYAKLKGRTLDTLTGNQCFRVLEGSHIECEKCLVRNSIESKDPMSKQKQVTLPDGSEAWVEIITYPIYDENGEVRYIVEYTRDVTGRVKAEDDRKRLIKDLELLSRTDSLTGMLNRRAVNAQLEQEFWRARRHEHQLSVILCDIDDLKVINDTDGHAAGDSSLLRVAGSICEVLRQTDYAGRYGGDEFLILLPETDSEGATQTAERLRMEVSIGISTIRNTDKKAGDIITRADVALYESKESGKNRVTLAKGDAAETAKA